jgi:hypothetical protein
MAVGFISSPILPLSARLLMCKLSSIALLPAILLIPCTHAADIFIRPELGMLFYQSEERNEIGSVLNKETGRLPLLGVSLQVKEAPWFLKVNLARAQGEVDYQGYTQMGIPLTTRTELSIDSWQVLLGYQWPILAQQQISLGAGINGLQIDRNILPTLGSFPLKENLASQRLVLSLMWQWQMLEQPLVLKSQLDILPQRQNRLTVDTQGLYDTIVLDADQHTDWRLAIDAQLRCFKDAELGLELAYQSYQPGSSQRRILMRNGIPAATIYYPGSDQRLIALKAQFGWHF